MGDTPTNTEHVYTYHQDPGHGWMQIKLTELGRLGIWDRISDYSYSDGEYAYLEEDSDMSKAIRAIERTGQTCQFEERHIDEEHWIRSLPSYKYQIRRI